MLEAFFSTRWRWAGSGANVSIADQLEVCDALEMLRVAGREWRGMPYRPGGDPQIGLGTARERLLEAQLGDDFCVAERGLDVDLADAEKSQDLEGLTQPFG